MAIGTTLRNARIQRGLSIEQVAQDTRISARFLEALEDEAFDELPAPVYARGFLRSYANYLKVDANPLLEELNNASSRPLTGPDSFVGGPGAQQRPQRPASNPFQRTPPPPARPPQPEPVQAAEDDIEPPYEDIESDGWAPGDDDPADEPRRQLSGRYYENEPTVEPLPPAEEPFRPRRVAGVLLEREERPGEAQAGTRVLAMVGGAVIIVLFVLAAAVILTRNGDDGTNVAAPDATETPTSKPGTVIAYSSATTSATASPSASASASASPSGTPGTATPSVSATPATATPTPRPGTPTPTLTPETPTPTQAPPTPTPTQRPPTATPTIAVPLTGSRFSECTRLQNGDTDCGPQPYRVVCFPGGWYVDVLPRITLPNLPGWSETYVTNPSFGKVMDAAEAACE